VAGTVTRRNSTPVLENSQGDDSKAKGGKSLLKAALIVLAVWLVGVLGLYEAGNLVHVLLLVGLLMLLLGALKARDEVRHHDADSAHDAR
jgi:hypothetical protein